MSVSATANTNSRGGPFLMSISSARNVSGSQMKTTLKNDQKIVNLKEVGDAANMNPPITEYTALTPVAFRNLYVKNMMANVFRMDMKNALNAQNSMVPVS